MKILFDHANPFSLSHGGFQIQISQTKAALENLGVEVEWLRWWDDAQTGQIIHFFGRPFPIYVQLAQQKGIKVVLAELLTGLGSRSPLSRFAQQALIKTVRQLLPDALWTRLAWDSYRLCDACVALTPWEAQLMTQMFQAPPHRIQVVPNGVDPVFLESQVTPRGQWLICTATITQRKRILELAQTALLAQTPVWVVGKAYSETDPYFRQFESLARQHPGLLRYEGGIADRSRLAQAYRQARGFVLLSTMESLSLSALEAAACGCPLLLSDLPWARTVFGPAATYCPIASPPRAAPFLRRFYDQAPELPPPPRPKTWLEVGGLFVDLYRSLLRTSK